MKKLMCALMAVLFIVTGCAAQEAVEKRSAVGFYFDTVITLTAYTADPGLLDEAFSECQRYENMMSKTIEGSDVWNINHANGQKVSVSPETLEVLKLSMGVSELCGGTFDITVGPEVALWDFTGGTNVVPDPKALEEAAKRVDYTKVNIEGNQVSLPADMQIDLGAVAKGFIADKIAQFVRDRGVTSALLNFGGNVITVGEKPNGEGPWRVGLQNPDQTRGEYLMAVYATDLAVVTSGIYERGFDLDGVRYHHLLDPKTGWPAQNDLSAVTILTAQSGLADALSTAAFVMGAEKGRAFIESLDGVEAIFVTRDDEILATSGASALVVTD